MRDYLKEKSRLIQVNPLVWVAHVLQETFEILALHDERGGVDAGVEAHALSVLQLPVEEDMYVVFGVVDESERRYGTGHHAQILHQPLLGGKAQFALVQLFFDVVDVHVLVAIEADQIVLVALVVAEEEVLAVFGIVSRPVLLCNFDGRRRRVLQVFVRYVQLIQQFI